MIINKNSWHYELIKKFTSYHEWDLNDSCEYIRAVGWGMLGMFAFIFGVSVVSIFFVVNPVAWLTASFMWGFTEIPESVAVMLMIVVIFLGASIIVYIGHLLSELKEKRRKAIYEGTFRISEEPTFMSQAIDRFKNKFCSKIEFTGEYNETV